MVSLRSLPLLALPLLAMACASATEESTATDTSNLDTSGCSGVDGSQRKGAISVDVQRPPTASCWNIEESGVSIGYTWSQSTATSTKDGLSFWVGLNGASTTVKAEPADCQPSSGGIVYSPDTSGVTAWTCTAWARVDFKNKDFKAAAYGNDGHRVGWDVQVAVALPDGTWDSLDGANYHFAF